MSRLLVLSYLLMLNSSSYYYNYFFFFAGLILLIIKNKAQGRLKDPFLLVFILFYFIYSYTLGQLSHISDIVYSFNLVLVILLLFDYMKESVNIGRKDFGLTPFLLALLALPIISLFYDVITQGFSSDREISLLTVNGYQDLSATNYASLFILGLLSLLIGLLGKTTMIEMVLGLVSLIAIVNVQTRGPVAIFALAVMLLVFWNLIGRVSLRINQSTFILLALGLIGFIFFSQSVDGYVSRFTNDIDKANYSGGRQEIWERAFEVAFSSTKSINTIETSLKGYSFAHNFWLDTFLFAGPTSFYLSVIFGLMYLKTIITNLRWKMTVRDHWFNLALISLFIFLWFEPIMNGYRHIFIFVFYCHSYFRYRKGNENLSFG